MFCFGFLGDYVVSADFAFTFAEDFFEVFREDDFPFEEQFG